MTDDADGAPGRYRFRDQHHHRQGNGPEGTALDERALRNAFGLFATGVAIVTGARPNGTPVGVTVNSFCSVSLSPPLVLWCLQRESRSIDAFGTGRAFAVHILRLVQQDEALHFARRATGKFPPEAVAAPDCPPLIGNALCRFDCAVEARHAGGDHLIIVGKVLRFEAAEGESLVFHSGTFGRFTPLPRARHVEAWETFTGDWF